MSIWVLKRKIKAGQQAESVWEAEKRKQESSTQLQQAFGTPCFPKHNTKLTWSKGAGPGLSEGEKVGGLRDLEQGQRRKELETSFLHSTLILVLSLLSVEVKLKFVRRGTVTGRTQACLEGGWGTREQFSS